MTTLNFDNMVTGLPADEAAARAQIRVDLQSEESKIANTSPYSPFFVLLAAIFTAPALWLRDFIVGTALPGLFAQTASGALLDVHAEGMDTARGAASKAKELLTFSRNGTSGNLTIPAGTIVESPAIDGVVYRMITDADTDITDGNTSALVSSTAEAVGAAYNLGDGYYSLLPVAVPGIVQVSNEAGWLITPGMDTESDADLRERLRLLWRRQSGWHTADTYRSLISEVAGIDPGDVYFDLSAPRGAGSADAYILTESGIPSAALVQAADDHINVDGNHGLGDDLRVKAMPALNVDIDITVIPGESATAADKAELATNVENLVRAIFRESSAYPEYPRVAPHVRVSRSAISGYIHSEFPLAEAVDWTAPATDPQPDLNLPMINTLSVTVP